MRKNFIHFALIYLWWCVCFVLFFVFVVAGWVAVVGGRRSALRPRTKWSEIFVKLNQEQPFPRKLGLARWKERWPGLSSWVCLALLSCKKQRAHSRASPSTCRSSPWDGGQPPAYAFLSFQVSDFRFLSGHLVDWSSNSKALYVNLPLGRKEVPSTNVINLDFWDSRVSALKK